MQATPLRGLCLACAAAGLLLAGASHAAAAERTATLSVYQQEAAMGAEALIARWDPFVTEAARRFDVPSAWIRAVMIAESGGRTMIAEGVPITSRPGAMGLMQLMPASWQEMRTAYALGGDPHDPHDNIVAGTAMLRVLYAQYGYPGLFAAYNDGPGMVEARRQAGQMLPDETVAYVLQVARILRRGQHGARNASVDPKAVDPAPTAESADETEMPRALEYPDDPDAAD
ncbi:MAG: lytic transglycosylase domain-containing protein [Rhizomicrobium sp.]